MKRIIYFILMISMLAGQLPVAAQTEIEKIEFYVAVDGSDENSGTKDAPFATIERAKEAVREIKTCCMRDDITVYLREGIYRQTETLTFTEKDSGTNGYKVRYVAYGNEKVTITGGSKVTGWEQYNDKIWKASYGDGDYVRQLYVNGNRGRRAQTEGLEHISELYNDVEDEKYTTDGVIVDSDRFSSYANKEDIQIHMGRGWRNYLFNVTDIKEADAGKSIFMLGADADSAAKQNLHPLKADVVATIENAFEELDTEGEFYYNRQERILYYMPRSSEDMKTADVWVAELEILMKLKGRDANKKVRNIEFNGITFANATWKRPSKFGLYQNQLQTVVANKGDERTDVPSDFVPACIQLHWAEKISFINNTFKDMGTVGIGLYQGVSYCNFEGNTFADIADSAITVGLTNQPYEDMVYEGYNLAADKPATASGYISMYPPKNAVDVSKKDLWAGQGSGNVWLQVDLLEPYRIDRIEVDGRPGLDMITARRNFEVIASNDPEFNDYETLAVQGSEPFDNNGMCVLYSNSDDAYRYVRVRKTVPEYFEITELRIINEDMPYAPAREVCKFNRIRNNYFTRTGYVNYGAAAITAYYVENLDVSHNEIYNVAYSGISIGWGWASYPDSKVARDNKVMYNRVHKCNMINFDGGAFYSLGQQPNSLVSGNYMSDQPNYIATFYSDNGTKYQTVVNNVSENVNQSYFLNLDTDYLTYKNNYSPHTGLKVVGDHTIAEPIIRYIPGNPPMEALKIMKNAGIEEKWQHIKERAGEDMWPVNTELMFADILYDGIEKTKFRENYLKNFITSAVEWLKLVQVGTDIGTYTEEGYNTFKQFIDTTLEEINATTEVDRNAVIDKRLEYEQKLENFKESRNTLPMNELVSLAKDELSNAIVGTAVGNVSKKSYNEFEKMITATEGETDEISKLMLERAIIDFRSSKINLDITGFALGEQLEVAEIDSENNTITAKVKYTADMTRVIPQGIDINENVVISPKANQPVNLEDGQVYTVSTIDGSESSDWMVNIIRPDVISSEEPYSLKEIIADKDNWNTVSATNSFYKDALFGDITLKFKVKVDEYVKNDWPSITFRNQSATEVFAGPKTSGYIIVLADGTVEFHRFNDGVRTQFYGVVGGIEQLLGPKVKTNAFVFGKENDMELTCKNTDEGVRIIFSINGEQIFDVLDNYPGAITTPGYFGTISPFVHVKLSAE